MRLLLDECVPRPLKALLAPHDTHHVVEMGWAGQRNGALLKLMLQEHFQALLTVDKRIEFQQNVAASGLAVVVLIARTNRLADLTPLIPAALRELETIGPGQLIRVGA